jgi:hypothetical protein
MQAFINPLPILYEPFTKNQNIYDSVLTTKSLPGLYHNYPFKISPATDNEPFFNHHTRWSALDWSAFKDIFSQKRMGRMALEDKPIAEVSLLVLLAQVLVISALFIVLPLWRFSSSGLKVKSVFPSLVYFSGLGCGFILIEIVMLHQFGLLLGEPVYTFAIVLAALLLFTGLGSYVSGKYFKNTVHLIRNSILLLSVLLLTSSFLLMPLLQRAIALPTAGRIGLSLLLIFPLGILLGIPFPAGITMLKNQAPSLIPWAWGVNGFFTVIGAVIALILSMMVGFQAVLWIATAIYLLSLFFITRLSNK